MLLGESSVANSCFLTDCDCFFCILEVRTCSAALVTVESLCLWKNHTHTQTPVKHGTTCQLPSDRHTHTNEPQNHIATSLRHTHTHISEPQNHIASSLSGAARLQVCRLGRRQGKGRRLKSGPGACFLCCLQTRTHVLVLGN